MNVNDKANDTARKISEKLEGTSNELSSKAKGLWNDADGKRVVIRSHQGRELLTLPLPLGILGGAVAALSAPQLAALAAIGGFAAKLKIELEDNPDRVVKGNVASDVAGTADHTPTASSEAPEAFVGETDLPRTETRSHGETAGADPRPDTSTQFVDTTPVTPETVDNAREGDNPDWQKPTDFSFERPTETFADPSQDAGFADPAEDNVYGGPEHGTDGYAGNTQPQ